MDPSAGELWYTFEPVRAGYVTLDAPAGGVDLTLYNADLNEIASATRVGSRQRIDWDAPVSGETYYLCVSGSAADVDLRLANLVSHDGRMVDVSETDGDDRFELAIGESYLTINGVEYEYDDGPVEWITFSAGTGHDAVAITGSDGKEVIDLAPGMAVVSTVSYRVGVTGAESIRVDGGGGTDEASLYGHPAGKDTFRADPHGATMSGVGYVNQVVACRYVYAHANPGNQDVAVLHDDPGQSDTFEAWPEMARLYGSQYYNRVKSFGYVHAYGTPGNQDVALLHDSTGNDVFEAWPETARLYGPGFYNRAKSFDWVHGKSTAGGVDVARLYGSQADDTLTATPQFTRLRGDGFYNRAVSFEQVEAHGRGGNDVAGIW